MYLILFCAWLNRRRHAQEWSTLFLHTVFLWSCCFPWCVPYYKTLAVRHTADKECCKKSRYELRIRHAPACDRKILASCSRSVRHLKHFTCISRCCGWILMQSIARPVIVCWHLWERFMDTVGTSDFKSGLGRKIRLPIGSEEADLTDSYLYCSVAFWKPFLNMPKCHFCWIKK